MKSYLLFIMLCLPMFKVEANVCSIDCQEKLSCQAKKKPIVKKSKKKKKIVKKKQEQLPICEVTETIFVDKLPDSEFNARWNMPLPPLRDSPAVSVPSRVEGTVPNFSAGSFVGGGVGWANNGYVVIPRYSPVTNVPVNNVPLPASALLFLPAFSWLLLRRYK